MKRDLDLIRELLLAAEKTATLSQEFEDWPEFFDKGYTDEIIFGHLLLLKDAGFAVLRDGSSMSGLYYSLIRITNSGHDYLDSVRDPKIWRDTKAGLSKAGGTASLAIVQATAIAVFKTALSKSGINIP